MKQIDLSLSLNWLFLFFYTILFPFVATGGWERRTISFSSTMESDTGQYVPSVALHGAENEIVNSICAYCHSHYCYIPVVHICNVSMQYS